VQQADAIFRKAAVRLIPVMALMYVVSYLDRSNISFAALTMNKALGFSPEVYGFGSGIFFWGYFLFEVPSNLMLEKVGARAWMCRIMVTWGLISMACAFIAGPLSFYILRFLLGAAEAGLYPGMILYMTYWFPEGTRGRFIATFLAAVPMASIVGGPLSGWLLDISGHGLSGWQWLLLLEGAPSVLLGVALLWLLPDRPAVAKWLTAEEKSIVLARLAEDQVGDNPAHTLNGFWEMLADKRIWILIIPDFGIVIGLYGLGLWMPQIINGLGFSHLETGFLVMVPYLIAIAAMVLVGRSSDRRGERVLHVAGSAFVASAGLAGAALLHQPALVIASFCVASAGIYSALAVFWTLPTSILRGVAAAGGLALLNSFANLGGFFGPGLMGWLKQETGNYSGGLLALAGMEALAGVAVILIGRAFFRRPA
jgi:ACS family tartrate transporter-like MFS transporter